jgi:hypothetical protein
MVHHERRGGQSRLQSCPDKVKTLVSPRVWHKAAFPLPAGAAPRSPALPFPVESRKGLEKPALRE